MEVYRFLRNAAAGQTFGGLDDLPVVEREDFRRIYRVFQHSARDITQLIREDTDPITRCDKTRCTFFEVVQLVTIVDSQFAVLINTNGSAAG